MMARELSPKDHQGMVVRRHTGARHVIQHVEQRSWSATILWDEANWGRAVILRPEEIVTVTPAVSDE